MKKEVFSLLLKACFGFLLLSMFISCSKSTDTEIPSSSEEYPEDEILVDGMPEKVAEMKQKGVEVYKNEKGYWEADLGNLLVWVYVPAGQFPMGSDVGEPDELPIHVVYLDGYWINKYQTTVAQFREFVEDTGYITEAEKGMGSWQYVGGNPKDQDQWEPVPDGNWRNTYFEQGDDHPVVSVSWIDGYTYSQWLAQKLDLPVNLPTEAQWEKAARGRDGRPYPWGFENPDGTRANYADVNFFNKYGDAREPDPSVDDGYTETSPAGAFPAGQSPYGVFDLAGNSSEWIYDWRDPNYYANSPERNPIGPNLVDKRVPYDQTGGLISENSRIMRSEAWTARSGVLTPVGGHNIRSAERSADDPYSSDDHVGFRMVIDYIDRPY